VALWLSCKASKRGGVGDLTQEQLETLASLIERLHSLGVTAKFADVAEGPVVTVYRFLPTGKTRVSHLEALSADFAVATGSEAIVVKRIPGDTAVGVFVPNRVRVPVHFRDCVAKAWGVKDEKAVPLCLGIDNYGNFVVEDLAEMPHLLVAGSTGSGKSTLLTSLIAASVYLVDSSRLALILSDTKGVEFAHFAKVPHLLFQPATSPYETCERMEWLIAESERRMKLFARCGLRNVREYNEIIDGRNLEVAHSDEGKWTAPLPAIVLVIDELADILTDRSKTDDKLSLGKLAAAQLSRIVARSRAAGCYVIAATQRPSVDIVAGSIKSNFPARISFRLPSQIDSRTVLGYGGAEHLLSQGDMLFVNPNKPGLIRLHAPLASYVDVGACVEASVRSTNA